jgi:hypothetical protein
MAENEVENLAAYKSKYSGPVIDAAVTDWLDVKGTYLFTTNIVYKDKPETINIPVLESMGTISTDFLPKASTDIAGVIKIGEGFDFDRDTGVISVNADIRKLSAKINSKVEYTDLYDKYIKFKLISNSTNTYAMVIETKQNLIS